MRWWRVTCFALARRPVAGSAALADVPSGGAVANPDRRRALRQQVRRGVQGLSPDVLRGLPRSRSSMRGEARRRGAHVEEPADHGPGWPRGSDLCKKNGGIYVKAGSTYAFSPSRPPLPDHTPDPHGQRGGPTFPEDRATFSRTSAWISRMPSPHRSHSGRVRAWRRCTKRRRTERTVAVKIQQRPVARFLATDLATIDAYYSLLSFLIPGLTPVARQRDPAAHGEELDFRGKLRTRSARGAHGQGL